MSDNFLKMKPQHLPLYKYALLYGLILAGIPTLYNVILLLFGLHLDYNYYGENIGHSYEKSRIFLLPVILLIAVYKYRKINSGVLKLSEAIMIGFWIVLISSLVVISYNLIFRTFIEPDFSAKFYEINREHIFNELVACCDYSDAELENHENTHRSLLNSFSTVVILSFFFASVYSSIIGLILRRKTSKISENNKKD